MITEGVPLPFFTNASIVALSDIARHSGGQKDWQSADGARVGRYHPPSDFARKHKRNIPSRCFLPADDKRAGRVPAAYLQEWHYTIPHYSQIPDQHHK